MKKKSFFSKLYKVHVFVFVLLVPLAFPIVAVIWPFWAYIELKEPRYIRHYPRYVKRGFVNMFQFFSKKSAWKTVLRSLKTQYFTSEEEIETQLKKRRGNCLRCGNCCTGPKCALLEWDDVKKQWYCPAHDHPFWGHIHCSKYPLNQEEVELYNCKGYWFEE
jgi:hypothetical protein